MIRQAAILMLVACSTTASATDAGISRSGRELDAEGAALSRAGDLKGALARFKEAFTADPKLAIAHYDFAAMIFGALEADGCSELGSMDEALDHLARSVQLDPSLLKRLRADPGFEGFRHSAGYFVLLGDDVHSVKGIAALLPKLNLQAPTRADSGPFFKLQFHPRGKVDVLDHDLTDDGYKWVKRSGTWRLTSVTTDGGEKDVILELEVPATKTFNALKYSGRVHVDRSGLVLEDPNAWPCFANDRWSDCCC